MIYSPSNIYGKVKIGTTTDIGCFCDIGNCVIGEHCSIQTMVSIPVGTVIGDNVFLGPGVRILNDKYPPSDIVSGVTIEDDARIGGGAIILPGVTIGRAALIGAGSVVTKNVGAGEVWYGNPARKQQ